MKTTLLSKLAGASLLAFSLIALPAAAQTTPVDPTTPSEPAVPVEPGVDTDDYEVDDNDSNWGWLGLLGLAGLAGLKRRDNETVRYRSNDDVAATTTTDPRY